MTESVYFSRSYSEVQVWRWL